MSEGLYLLMLTDDEIASLLCALALAVESRETSLGTRASIAVVREKALRVVRNRQMMGSRTPKRGASTSRRAPS